MATIRTQFSSHLVELRTHVTNMGAVVDRMLEAALLAVTDYRPELTKQVIRTDDEVDSIDAAVERDAALLIALQQPVAADLRVISTALKAITDLERIGDYAVDIAKIGRRIAKRGVYRPLVDLPRLAACVRSMLRDALRAMLAGDLKSVQPVIEADDEVDDLYHAFRDQLIEEMERDSGVVYQGAYMLLACKYLERAGDHVVNVAEHVYYMVTGEPAQDLAKKQRRTRAGTIGQEA